MRPKLISPFVETKEHRGVALILVMLAMLVLSALAASIVFTARSETFASYNYRLDTQADYLAKAGIQSAINFIRSSKYQPVKPAQATTYYSVTSTGAPYNLYIANTSPVQCVAAGSTCATASATVQLMGYGTGVGGSSATNFPTAITNAGGTVVTTAFTSALNDAADVNNRVSGDAANSGFFQVNATLLYYQTVQVTPPPPNNLYPYNNCDPPGATFAKCAMETWLITSRATWTGPSTSTSTVAAAEESAIVQPIYWPTWGNALYGYCSVSMSGSSGVCTDAFNSSFGSYGNGTNKTASGACGTGTGNVIDTGAGVGANGGVTLGSNVTVGGNVTIGTSPTSGCAASGYTGSTSSVLGEVINGPHVDPPAVPTFPAPFPTGATNVTVSNPAKPAGTFTVPSEFSWATLNTAGSYPAGWPFPLAVGGTPIAPPSPTACIVGLICNGTKANPYLIGTLKMTGSNELDLLGGPDANNPVYYDIDQIAATGGTIVVSGYVVINVKTSVDFEGNGITSSVTSGAETPPMGVQMNYAGSSPMVLGGNGALCAVVSAPLADVSFKGGGSGGYMIGAVQANNITDGGGYPIHYDVQLGRTGGTLGKMVSTAYSRKKM